MKIIRRSVFETNSSSTHAIAITKSDKNLQSPGYISLDYDGEYSWDYKVINDLDGKFTYLAVIASNYIDNLFKIYYNICDKIAVNKIFCQNAGVEIEYF